ncbi:MAG: flippase-like domain-containing protein [Candidatus Aenigmarchaeota archaeon]|nr:flippase-like domain-containing protein [Candidatus Aenigmarchaeota archaeon]
MISKYLNIKLVVGLIIITLLVIGFSNSVTEHIHAMNPFYVGCAVVVLLSVITVKQIKWYMLMGEVRNAKLAFKSYFTGQFVNDIAPVGTGDVTKAYIIKKYTKKPFGFALSISYMERLVDISILSIFAVISSMFFFVSTISSYISIIVVIVFVLGIGFFLLAMFPVKLASIIKSILVIIRRIIPAMFIVKIIKKLETFIFETSKDFQEALVAFKNRRMLIIFIIMLAVLDWLLEGVCQVVFLYSLGYEIPILVSVGIVAISWLISIPSMIPSGLGIRETVLSLLFSSMGVPFAVALTSVLVYRAFATLIFASGAVISLKIEPK